MELLHGVGLYSYSFSSFLLSSLLCGFISNNIAQWILIGYSAITSVLFLISTYWAELNSCLDNKPKLITVGVIGCLQLYLLLVFKLYFFKHVSYNTEWNKQEWGVCILLGFSRVINAQWTLHRDQESGDLVSTRGRVGRSERIKLNSLFRCGLQVNIRWQGIQKLNWY